jgi:NTP pyrophosphatase (non-canonical NTP hydrolase)
MELTFRKLRLANIIRLPKFKNKMGKPAHSKPDGSDWDPAHWLQALVGEVGEFANLRKKFERGDIGYVEYAVEAEKELADIQTYLDILAMRALDYEDFAHPTGIDLDYAVQMKFNEVSRRVSCDVFLREGIIIEGSFPET